MNRHTLHAVLLSTQGGGGREVLMETMAWLLREVWAVVERRVDVHLFGTAPGLSWREVHVVTTESCDSVYVTPFPAWPVKIWNNIFQRRPCC